ncbi:MAG TPA: hypothetical protein VK675_03605 [Candidatus Paceibacterota bacterium]|nr:hypothetical protein [Candidatus Paceibacterota bacterium]
MPKIKNIIIFLVIGAAIAAIYIFFIKPSPQDSATLVSSSGTPAVPNLATGDTNATEAQDFLNLLLNVRNIKLNSTIFSDNAFISLHDSSITLTPDGNEGRVNPFARIGFDDVDTTPLTCTLPQVLNPTTNTCVTPLTCVLPKVLNTTTNTCVTTP